MRAWIARAYFVIEYSIDSMSLLKSKLSLLNLVIFKSYSYKCQNEKQIIGPNGRISRNPPEKNEAGRKAILEVQLTRWNI